VCRFGGFGDADRKGLRLNRHVCNLALLSLQQGIMVEGGEVLWKGGEVVVVLSGGALCCMTLHIVEGFAKGGGAWEWRRMEGRGDVVVDRRWTKLVQARVRLHAGYECKCRGLLHNADIADRVRAWRTGEERK
jgi:hypothetical protein